ncbi:MAG: hypothetical protein K1Y01_18785 [Vicinamibacteria bacterium]|nr:hypothetical protein [Vicinamibacteria bacterium]
MHTMIQGDVRAAIEEAFPFVEKPPNLSIHEWCTHCDMSSRYLEQYSTQELPVEATRWLCDELSTLSPEANRWVMASYLRHVLIGGEQLERATEHLIYHFGPAPEHEEEVLAPLALMSQEQFRALRMLVEYLGEQSQWQSHCPSELAKAMAFLQRLEAESERTQPRDA